ncbi:hypothetical protein GW17_00012178 [Ensete ventricosum]|nr:hypothetical protein GW17_00012178 [Ensete ventricosum]RZR87178.1 hypothetical protein BHM03_00014533 [Ensete ventricosum]
MMQWELIESSPGVRWELAKGDRDLTRNASGVRQKMTETCREFARGYREDRRELGRISSGESHGLHPVISRRVPSELPDPFSESPSELSVSSYCIIQSLPNV